jgi:hypothetical protein
MEVAEGEAWGIGLMIWAVSLVCLEWQSMRFWNRNERGGQPCFRFDVEWETGA